ncbi:MAG: hypothetical protein Q9220_002685 [cf. Caloplaca sp. 1 TL-2023]
MSFRIEVPGASNPFNEETLYRTLKAAASSDGQLIKEGTQQLQNWETKDGYYSALQSIFIDTSLPLEFRFLCIIQIKIGIDKYWRKTANSTIQKTEKDLIRSRSIVSGTNEPESRLALQNALVIAKIIRYEYPVYWPDAVSSLVSNLRLASQSHNNSLPSSRALLILLEVIKELSTARIQRTRTSLQAAAPEVLEAVGSIYADQSSTWMNFTLHGGDDEGGAINSIEQSLLALRVLRRLLVAGWDAPNRSAQVQQTWQMLSAHFQQMLDLAIDRSTPIQSTTRHMVEKHLRQIAKLHVGMAKDHPSGFTLLPDAMSLIWAYWKIANLFGASGGDQEDGRDLDASNTSIVDYLALKGLLLIRACVKMVFRPAQTFKFQQPEDKEEKAQAQNIIEDHLLTLEFAQTTVETLMTRFFVFTPQDFRDWDDDPEEWERREEGEDDVWEFSVRSCAEKLFLDLIISKFKPQLIGPLISVFGKAANLQNKDVMQKDSIYCAVGIAAPALEDRVDFSAYLGLFAQEVQLSEPGYNILRRRIAIVLGQWLSVKEGLDRPLIYQIFQYLLDKDQPLNDLIVRITAGKQLKNVILPFEFSFEAFQPYASTILQRLLHLIEEVDMTETKLALLNTLSTLIQNAEEKITPFADQILSFLPSIWEQAVTEYLTKQSVLGILTSLTAAIKDSSQQYHNLIIPLIGNAVDVDSSTRVYLIDDALDLWSTLLHRTSLSAVPSVLPLVPHLFPMLQADSEILRKALELMETYIYLAPLQFLSSTNLYFGRFTTLLKAGSKREAAGLVLTLIELLIRSALETKQMDTMTDLISRLLEANILQTMLEGLHNAHEAHATTGPNRHQTWLDVLVETDFFTVFSRLAIASPTIVLDAIRAAIPGQEVGTSMNWILTEWFRHLDNISHPEKKKLNGLALTALLQTGEVWILEHLQELVALWTELVFELYENEEKVQDCFVYEDPELLKSEEETAEEARQRTLLLEDPIHRLDFKSFIREQVQHAITLSGGNEAFQARWLVNIDQDVLREFGKLGIL